ncbi:MAG: nuclear transport factor 2 family protein [Deltaproteobacteria bacterium]|nr:nuclear transport factor 2 family protein [Deltaproteobacteria bacterium]
MDPNHPALVAARSSWRCVHAKDKQGWLDLMAEDICVEDPIGLAVTNPDGKGIRGKPAMREFWEKNIDPNTIVVETHESFAAGDESAHRMTLTTAFPGGMKMIVNGIFTYRVNGEGKLTNLRGYWAVDEAEVVKP